MAFTYIKTDGDPDATHKWEALTQSDAPEGRKIKGGKYTVHAQGNFAGSATVELQYATDNSDFVSIDSTNLLFSAEGVYNFEIANGYVKPVVSAGSGSTDIDLVVKPIPRG